MPDGVKPQLDRVVRALMARYGPLPSLYLLPGQGPPLLNWPATAARVEEAERLLGFALPALLKAVYLRVANGGEALCLAGIEPGARRPGFPVLPLCDIVAGYFSEVRGFPLDYEQGWPAAHVPVYAGHGCSLVSCVDCTSPEGAVWLVNEGTWTMSHPTLADYLEEAITTSGAF